VFRVNESGRHQIGNWDGNRDWDLHIKKSTRLRVLCPLQLFQLLQLTLSGPFLLLLLLLLTSSIFSMLKLLKYTPLPANCIYAAKGKVKTLKHSSDHHLILPAE
jgi:hypothetical protein